MRQYKVEILRISSFFMVFFYRRLLARRIYIRSEAARECKKTVDNSFPSSVTEPKRELTLANDASSSNLSILL